MEIPDKQDPRAQVHLVDVYVHEEDQKTVLDITLHNAGSQVALPTRAKIKILDVAKFFHCDDSATRSFLQVAQIYDVTLSPDMQGVEQIVKIAHQLRPGHSERFQLIVSQQTNDQRLAYAWYCLQITILYNAQAHNVQAQPVLISIPPVNLTLDNVWEDAEAPHCALQNITILQRMATLAAERSTSVEATIQKYQQQSPIPQSAPSHTFIQPQNDTAKPIPQMAGKQEPVAPKHSVRNNVFISYSRQDEKYLRELLIHLAHYERENTITSWADTKINAGDLWYDELEQARQSAKVAVFLISDDFLASDFIFKYELSPLLEAARQGGVVVFSVILGYSAFMDTELAKFQAVNEPSEPLNKMPRWKRDQVWSKMAKQIKTALSS